MFRRSKNATVDYYKIDFDKVETLDDLKQVLRTFYDGKYILIHNEEELENNPLAPYLVHIGADQK